MADLPQLKPNISPLDNDDRYYIRNVHYKNKDGQWYPIWHYTPTYSEWGPCSKPCGGGIQTRTATIVRNDGVIYDPKYFNNAANFTLTQKCNTQSCLYSRCVAPYGNWRVPKGSGTHYVPVGYQIITAQGGTESPTLHFPQRVINKPTSAGKYMVAITFSFASNGSSYIAMYLSQPALGCYISFGNGRITPVITGAGSMTHLETWAAWSGSGYTLQWEREMDLTAAQIASFNQDYLYVTFSIRESSYNTDESGCPGVISFMKID